MDDEAIRVAVETERLALCRLLQHLDQADWSTPSLCGQWTVKDVVAHLTTTTRTGIPQMLWRMAWARGNFDRMSSRMARDLANRRTPEQLLQQLRETAGSSRRMPGSDVMDPLVDVIVHTQDVALPLGLSHSPPLEPVTASLDYVVNNRFYGNPERLEDVRLAATDVDWSSGEGEKAQGRSLDLLLVATGRPAGRQGLSGAGADLLASRLS